MNEIKEIFDKVVYLFEQDQFEYDDDYYSLTSFINKFCLKSIEIGIDERKIEDVFETIKSQHDDIDIRYVLEYFDLVSAILVQIQETDVYLTQDVIDQIEKVLMQIDISMDLYYPQ